jgi:hypothetical protein
LAAIEFGLMEAFAGWPTKTSAKKSKCTADFRARPGHSLFDLLWLTCYKTWSCVMGFGEVAVLCPSHDNSDAAKLSTPVLVLQWKRVRNSGHKFLALCTLRAAGEQCAGSR